MASLTHYYVLAVSNDGKRFYSTWIVPPEQNIPRLNLLRLSYAVLEIQELAGNISLEWKGYTGVEI